MRIKSIICSVSMQIGVNVIGLPVYHELKYIKDICKTKYAGVKYNLPNFGKSKFHN